MRTPYTSRLDAFRAFLLRSERYESVIPSSETHNNNIIRLSAKAVRSEFLHHKKVILLEQLPYLHGMKWKNDWLFIFSNGIVCRL